MQMQTHADINDLLTLTFNLLVPNVPTLFKTATIQKVERKWGPIMSRFQYIMEADRHAGKLTNTPFTR